LDTGGVQRSGVGACQGTVTINGKCYEQETVNYFEFGEMIRLCGGSEMQALATVSWWKIGGYWHLPQKEALGWTRAGYHGIVSGVPSTHEGCSISKVVSPTPLKATLNPAWASYWTPPFPLQWLFPQGQPGPTLGGWTIIM
jgi:hypothetical protein